MKKTIGFFLVLATNIASADFYTWKDAKGVQQFSDSEPAEKNLKDYKVIKGIAENFTPGEAIPVQPSVRYEPARSATHIQLHNTNAELSSCIETKRRAVRAEKSHSQYAEELNEWLWKNCQGYSNELRQIEQSMM